MVGVPGRSKACLTCKKRRIACDAQRPSCSQCSRSKRDCSYAKRHIFVLNDEGSHKTKYKKPAEADGAGSGEDATTSTNGECDVISDTKFRPFDRYHEVSRPVSTLTALKEQLLADALPSPDYESLDNLVNRPWTFTLSALGNSVHALNSAPLSCYTAWVGRQNREPYLVEASRRLYIQGLNEVQAAVNNPATALLDETLGACLGLIVYEALECPDRSRSGYSCHVEGCARIVKLRGAVSHQDGAAHDLFRAFRFIGLLDDLEKHRPSFLSTPAWTTLPWQKHPKTMHDRLLDLLALAPEVLQKGDQLDEQPPHLYLPALIELAEDVQATDTKLQSFYIEYVQSSAEPLYWEEVPRMVAVSHDSDSVVVPELEPNINLNFRDLETARVLTLYWAMLALSWSGLTDIYVGLIQLLASGAVPAALTPIVQQLVVEPRDWRDPCRKVCGSIRYCNSEAMGGLGPLRLAVPLDVVTNIMRNRTGCEKEYSAAVKVGKEISMNWLRVLQFQGVETIA